MVDVLIGLHMPYPDPLTKLGMERAAEVKLQEHGVTAEVKIVGMESGYVAVRGATGKHSLQDAQRFADIAEEAAWDVYGRSIS